MKHQLILALVLSAASLPAQTLVTHRLPQEEGVVKTLKVWLPKGYSKKHRYPLIVVLSGGDEELVARTASYYTERFHRIPPVIVVGIQGGADEMGFSYETGDVNDSGRRFASFLLQDLPAFLESRYLLAPYRGIFGHSYGANYTDFLVKRHPESFTGYALLAPEMPLYKFDAATALNRLGKPIYYYLASGKLDLDRRQEHARTVAGQFAKLQGKGVRFTHEEFVGADHLAAIPRAIPAALESLFADFTNFDYSDSNGKLILWFEGLNQRIERLYGVGITVDSTNAAYFCGLAVQKKDVDALNYFAGYFFNGRTDASILFNTAQSYMDLDELDRAKGLYERAILRAKETKRSDFLLMSYRSIALRIHSQAKQDPASAWKTLEAGHKDTGDVAFKMYFGMISARHGHRLDDGIRYLVEFEEERTRTLFGSLYPLDMVYATLAQCYLRKGNNQKALSYVDQALKINPANEDAAALRKKLG